MVVSLKFVFAATILGLCALAIIAQIFLSRREKALFGLILPIAALAISVFLSLTLVSDSMTVPELLGARLGMFASANIITVILLCIFFFTRHSQKQSKMLRHMRVQDLN